MLGPIVYVHHLVHELPHRSDTIAGEVNVSSNDVCMSPHLVVLPAHSASLATASLSHSEPLGPLVDLRLLVPVGMAQFRLLNSRMHS